MGLRDRFASGRLPVESAQNLLLSMVFLTLAAVVISSWLGRARIALWAIALVLWLMGAIQIGYPETMVQAARMGDRIDAEPGDPVTEEALLGKRLGGGLLVTLGVAIVLAQDLILGFF